MQYPPPLKRDHIPIGTSTPLPINKQYEILKKLNVSICFTSIFSFSSQTSYCGEEKAPLPRPCAISLF
jgi:hypothetical protein